MTVAIQPQRRLPIIVAPAALTAGRTMLSVAVAGPPPNARPVAIVRSTTESRSALAAAETIAVSRPESATERHGAGTEAPTRSAERETPVIAAQTTPAVARER